jgi:hypothetical protein
MACFHIAKKGSINSINPSLVDLFLRRNGMINTLMTKPLSSHQLFSGYNASPDEYPPANWIIPYKKLINGMNPLKTKIPPRTKIKILIDKRPINLLSFTDRLNNKYIRYEKIAE